MTQPSQTIRPLHTQFPKIWELADGPNPTLLKQYLEWLVDDNDRLQSAIDAMQWMPVGFNSLNVALDRSENGVASRSLHLNFYSSKFDGNEHPHGHSRDATGTWYSGPGTKQVITRWGVWNDVEDAKWFEKRSVVANMILDKGDGGRPDYHPLKIGAVYLRKLSTTYVASLGSQDFSSTEVHNVAIQFGNDETIAISVHERRSEEPAEFSQPSGLTTLKRLTSEQARTVTQHANELLSDMPAGCRLGPITMIYPTLDFQLSDMQETAKKTDARDAELFIQQGLEMIKGIAKL